MTIKEFELQHAFCILVKVLSSWSTDDYERLKAMSYAQFPTLIEREFMQRVFKEADKRRPLLIEGVVNPERTKSEPREYTPCGLPVRQSTAKQYRLTDRDKEYIKSFAVDGVVPLDAYLCALEHLPDQY